ncbi:ZIP zinc transporter-domain-containing protein [Absidia repens]|uniref:ZIP zinc transporter-domain-containing protein n=1 Tax=Absidia repens TaxID=90262 RepID=A0A1X2I8U3_9FUNG|nr:ZIP zinc transporter-domain-containing protein [Absidia repens]
MKLLQHCTLFFILLSCIACLTLAQVHDEHDHDHSTATATNNTTAVDEHNHNDHDHDHSTATATNNTTAVDEHNHSDTSLETEHTHDHAGHDHAGHGHSHAAGYDEETCALELDQPYDLNFRIGSLFIILCTSSIGIFSPILLHRLRPYKTNGIRSWILIVGKFFGTGIVLATSFVHMLPEAIERFGSPCLSEGWHSYHAFGGVFCMIAAFALQLIELAAMSHLDALKAKQQNQHGQITPGLAYENKVVDNEAMHVDNIKTAKTQDECMEQGHVHSAGFLESDDMSIRNINTLMLELGIAIHSIIIGITMGTSSEETFLVLFIALIFHQFFEGIALGTRINDLNCRSWLKPIVMSLFFVCTTPIGVAIGIGIKSVMDVPSTILAQAILDSLSAGILLYNAYISLMSSEINHSVSFRQSSFTKKSICLISMYIGAGAMSVLGLWA